MPATTAVPTPVMRVTRLIALGIGIGGVLFASLAVPLAWSQAKLLQPWYAWAAIPLFLGLPAVLLVVATRAPIHTLRLLMATMAAGYLAAVAAWPAMVRDPAPMGDDPPFLWYLISVSIACAAATWPTPVALGYATLTPATYGLVRFSPDGGTADALIAFQDALYTLGFGVLLVGAVVVLQRGALALERAAMKARVAGTAAAATRARESERTRLDAIIHDSIMSTLLIAGRNRDAALAPAVSSQATETVRVLDSLRDPESLGADLTGEQLAAQIHTAVIECAAPVQMIVDESWSEIRDVPADIARGATEATTEALSNSVKYADIPHRTVERRVVLARRDGEATVEISDDGAGFDPRDVAPNRLGLDVAIAGRMETLPGGTADVWSRPGRGTRVLLRWRAP